MLCYRFSLERLFHSDPLPKLGLERMSAVMSHLGHPQKSYPIFHVAGTNGKGSTCAFLESILRTAGYKTGLYTSPHLTCARERIQINRELITEEAFSYLENQISQDATFFERMTAMAFLHFAQQKVDVAIIEVGLGGRLDATNVVSPVVCGISRIDLDHQAILGDSLEQIAFEKAGIIKPGVPVCWSPQDPIVESVLARQVAKISPFFFPNRHGEEPKATWPSRISGLLRSARNDDGMGDARDLLKERGFELGLAGSHQIHNASLAVSMILASGFPVSEADIQKGLQNAHWPCRYEFISENILLDGAHNPAGTQALIKAIQQDKRLEHKKLVLSIGLTEGHDGNKIARLWADFAPDAWVCPGQSKSLRALPKEIVAQYFQDAGFQIAQAAPKNSFHIITGSLYWAGEMRSQFISMPVDPLSTYY